MKAFQVLAIAALSCVSRTTCTNMEKASKSDGAVRFKFDKGELLQFHTCVSTPSARALQFDMPENIVVEDFSGWYSRTWLVAPKRVEIFERKFTPKIKALRDALPKYFCQPLLEEDELRVVADLFSDRLDDILDQIRVDAELTSANASVSSLLHMTLFMTLPPLWHRGVYTSLYYPQELIPLMRKAEQHWEGRRQWREALEKAQREVLGYEGPVPAAVRQPDMTACQPRQENWDMLPDDIFMFVLCNAGPYIRYARLVCKKWRKVSTPFAVVGVLGWKKAFKVLSGRATFDELSLRLDSLARMALDELNRASHLELSSNTTTSGGETAATAHSMWRVTANDLRMILQSIDPYHVLSWYRDALFKFPGLDEMLEVEVFALFISVRDDLLVSGVLKRIIYQRPLGCCDLGWSRGNVDVGYRLVRAYLKNYPKAANGQPLPDEDTLTAWRNFGGF